MKLKYDKNSHLIVHCTELHNGKNIKIGTFYCILNGKTYDTLGGLRNAYNQKMTTKEYYDTYYKMPHEEELCVVCKKNHKVFKSLLEGYSNYCSSSCFNKTEHKRKIISHRFVGNEDKKISSDKKRKETFSKKTKDELNDITNRRMKTLYEKYGEDYMSVKTKKQWEKRTIEDIKNLVEKSNETKRKNGTSEYNYFSSSNKKICINDCILFLQGYEDSVIYFLVEDCGLSIDDIKIGKDVPRINHNCLSGVYHPDIYLKKNNLLIEVKSDYTFNISLDDNLKKQKSSFKSGYNHVFFVIKSVHKNRRLLEKDKIIFSNFLNMTISSQALEIEKVQRLSRDGEYTPIAIGSGSARVLYEDVI